MYQRLAINLASVREVVFVDHNRTGRRSQLSPLNWRLDLLGRDHDGTYHWRREPKGREKARENIDRLPRSAAFGGNRIKGARVDEDSCEVTRAATARCADRSDGSP